MYLFLKSITQLMLLISGILLLTGGLSKKEKYTVNRILQKRMLTYGIIIIVLTLVLSIPDMYDGFINGWNHSGK